MEAYRGTVSLPVEAGEHKRIEYALDGSSWQSYHAPVTIGNGIHTLRVHACKLSMFSATSTNVTVI